MIVLLDTSTPTCHLELYSDGEKVLEDDWQADRQLAEKLLGYLDEKLKKCGGSFHTISGIGVFKGPGSFTGLRIGIAVCNTIVSDRKIPIVGVTGDNWQETALERLKSEDEKMVLPEYGRPARITTPRK